MLSASAENRLSGIVHQVRPGAVNDEVDIRLDGGQMLVVTVTRASSQSLQLMPGVAVTALIPASAIILSDVIPQPLSADNVITGIVSARRDGAVSCEIDLEYGPGQQLTAVLSEDSAGQLALQPGRQLQAFFNAGSVILSLPSAL
ncbi:MAG: hypothetical protein CMI02_02475 [Oceanospirillaceae bacterium]|nr:hypothetical protein [Oceanospirillaceae bacterium]MBT10886.1 hypothetical protein [Oceanospirillaceae bacterium]|tara:strand:- start:20124 stop:20558 length:435 start_codon:yes stop_codon:yes gene_type:complete